MIPVLRRAVLLGALTAVLSAGVLTGAEAAGTLGTATSLRARATDTSAVLTWKAPPHATRFRVCLQEFAGQKPCARLSGVLTSPTTTFTGLAPTAGRDYAFTVFSYGLGTRTRSRPRTFDLQPPPPPAVPTGVAQQVGPTALTVTWQPSARATGYAVCLTTRATTETCAQTSPRSAAATATFTGLTPTSTGDYYYRVYAYSPTSSSRSARHRVDLPVGTVATVTAARAASGVISASWAPAVNAESYQLQIATDPAMTTDVRVVPATGTAVSATRLTIGTTYYYRVRGANGPALGPWTTVIALRLPSDPTRLAVLTYNLCGQDKCVTKANGMKRWTTRKRYAGAIARSSGASIIATQESHLSDTRFGAQLPGFGLAAYYSAKSLFYDKAKYDVQRSGVITLDAKEKKYAVWAQFRDKVTRGVFLVADVHLQPYKGRSRDLMRAAQTAVLLRRVAAVNTADVPVVYAGDFNSNKSNADQTRFRGGYDAVRKAFTAAHVPDTYDAAAQRDHATWNSANQAVNPPLKHTDHVDHIYADPEIAVSQWKIVVRLKGSLYATPFATDHNPLRAILTVPAR